MLLRWSAIAAEDDDDDDDSDDGSDDGSDDWVG
jgi:hypothetical protein